MRSDRPKIIRIETETRASSRFCREKSSIAVHMPNEGTRILSMGTAAPTKIDALGGKRSVDQIAGGVSGGLRFFERQAGEWIEVP